MPATRSKKAKRSQASAKEEQPLENAVENVQDLTEKPSTPEDQVMAGVEEADGLEDQDASDKLGVEGLTNVSDPTEKPTMEERKAKMEQLRKKLVRFSLCPSQAPY